VAEQTAELGRAVATPDFLLADGGEPLVVNGARLRWLEVPRALRRF
jgi:hypothetical protein